MIWNIVLLAYFGIVSLGLGQPEDCFVPGECLSSDHVGGNQVVKKEDCLELCKNTDGCAWFTFYPVGHYCHLLKNCNNLTAIECDDCLSGEGKCEIVNPICFTTGECDGRVIKVIEKVPNQFDCLASCQQTISCTWFTYIPTATTCVLYESCPVIDESCGEVDGCISGQSLCKNPSDSSWHMSIAGDGPGSGYLDSVELYNWQTGQQCFIESLPKAICRHSGTLLSGHPVVCGGNYDSDCFHYQSETKKWTMISDLMTGTSGASSVNIPDRGWFLFGGNGGNELNTSQKLTDIHAKWEEGPAVQANGIYGQCEVQLSETVTAFIGGNINPRNIYIYDWASQNPTFVLQNEKLLKDRHYSTCGLIKGKDGQQVVAIIGGYNQRGMEIWNPRTKTVELLWDAIPAENSTTNRGLQDSEMIPIKGGMEFILYGGYNGETQDGIWKYIVADNKWERIGNLLTPRFGHVTLPVSGVECP